MINYTQRLRLRPWNDMDAQELYELARDPRIGMLCGWKPFECIDDAHEATVADIGYWIGAPYWGNGYATEAGHAIIERARELGVETIILKYFDGNDASRRVSEKLGFAWHKREEDVEYPLIGKRLTVHWTELVLTEH